MKICAFIPVRGGSKSIPLKNIRIFAGKPLVYWAAKAASDCPEISEVYVSTDSEQIRETVLGLGLPKVQVIGRSAGSATDTAGTEIALLEFAKAYSFDYVALVQATSPLLAAKDLSAGIALLQEADSVLSVVRQKRFVWRQEEFAAPLNYDYRNRPRRQDFAGFLVENGAFYITGRKAFLETGCRLSGKIKTVEMPEESYYEIDEVTDWIIAEQLLLKRESEKRSPRKKIRMFLMDCDGTLTDGGMYYSAAGEAMKRFMTQDGMGIRLLKEHGIITGILTGENSEIVRRRGEKLGVDEIFLGVTDKRAVVHQLCQKYGIEIGEVAYIGDDLNDLGVMYEIGLAMCPSNATPEIKKVAQYVMERAGGAGAVREAAEFIIQCQLKCGDE